MAAEERLLELENELQNLRLELHTEQKTTARLKDELERQRGGESARLVAAQIEQLLSEVAGPVSQLLTQTHLLKVENRPVRAEDVLLVVTRLIRVLQDYGLVIEGEVGQLIAFDPNRHEALSAEDELQPGQAAIIRLVGLSYGGKLLRKAGVIVAAAAEGA
jgi:molecular chaperone GrpE (heat shock protein)